MKDINVMILDWLIAEREVIELINLKNAAVRSQQYAEAAKILEQQREVEKRIPSSDQLKELREKLVNDQQ
jgi:uncharacterized protein YqgQ